MLESPLRSRNVYRTEDSFPSQDQIAETVERFIRRHFQVLDTDHSFRRDAHLYEGGFVDSAGVVELIAFVEAAFEVKLEDEDLFGDEFTTINGISGVVRERLRERVSSTGGEPGMVNGERR